MVVRITRSSSRNALVVDIVVARLAPRDGAATALRVETPPSIRSITAMVSGPRSAKYPYVWDRQLALVVGCAHPRTADRHTPTAQRHRSLLVAVVLRRAVAVVLALRATTSATSASINSCTTPSPTPDTEHEQSSLAAPTSSPNAPDLAEATCFWC
jgi:hypothetical protein